MEKREQKPESKKEVKPLKKRKRKPVSKKIVEPFKEKREGLPFLTSRKAVTGNVNGEVYIDYDNEINDINSFE